MKTRVFFFLAAAALLAGCAKEIQAPVEMQTGEPFVLQVGINNPDSELESEPANAPTRTYLGDKVGSAYPVYWSDGDAIQVNDKTSNELSGIAAGTATTSFEFASSAPSTPYNILYPAGIYADATHVTLPAVQTYKAGGFADNMFPMAGYSADGSATTVSHLCAVVKVSILQETAAHATARSGSVDTDNIVAVRFKGGNSEKVSGNFEISYNPAALTAASGTGDDLEVRVSKSLATSTAEAVVYYIVVPARTYSNGFDIIVQDASGHIQTKTKSASVELVAGKMYSMTEFEFVPTSTELGITIASAEDLVNFATAYNNNEYAALGQSLVATISDNITFDATSSAAFNATGGIGTDDNGMGDTNYFNGIFNGGSDSYTVSGLEATVPMFSYIGENGIVKDLVLDNTCTFTFTHANTDEGMFGAIAGYHKGNIDNVKVSADISLVAVADVTNMTSLGGLVGYANGGKLQNGCEFSGLISTPSGFTSTGKLIIGGLAGRIKTSGSTIAGSYFKGAINNEAQITSTDKNNPYLIIGGVVGFVDGGATVSSTNATADHADEASAHGSLSGKIVNKTTVAYHSAVGGIVGVLSNGTVSSCTNAATIACSIFRGADGTGRYMRTGGIVGMNNASGTITGCTNNGEVTHRSNPRLQAIGGIVGYNSGTVSGCTNNAAVNHMTTGQDVAAGRVVSVGGVIGENYANNLVTNVHNTANLEISSMENGTNSEERMGGVIGYNEGTVTGGTTKDITNSGAVYSSGTYSNQFLGYYVGGIVGRTKAAVKYAKNTGRAYFRWNQTINVSKIHVGGIAGMAEGTSSSIENCENTVDADVNTILGGTYSAQVYLYLPGNASYSDSYVGGIAGLSEATDPVKDCTNGGEVRTAAGASTTPVTGIMMGGIIGKMTGSGEVNNGDNSGRVRINFTVAEDGHSGNYLGGIVGYITNDSAVTVTGCDNSGAVDITCGAGLVQDCIASGVVGRMDAPGSITSSNNNGGAIQMAITKNSVGPKDLYTAGVLGYSTNDVTISGCSNSGAISGGNATAVAGTAFYAGGIVAYLKGASEILDCSNTGSTVTTHAGNTDTIGSTCLTGGIAGFVEGTSDNPITIGGTTGCTVNTTAELSATRGWIGGVAAYAKYAQISKCTLESIVGGGCAARGAGGIVGKAEYCTISACKYNGDTIKANQIQAANGEGGIAGYLDNSTIDGCYCYATKFYNNNSQPFGGIVGVSNSGNTIQNCHYKSDVEGPTAGNAVTATVAGSGTFSGSNNAADL